MRRARPPRDARAGIRVDERQRAGPADARAGGLPREKLEVGSRDRTGSGAQIFGCACLDLVEGLLVATADRRPEVVDAVDERNRRRQHIDLVRSGVSPCAAAPAIPPHPDVGEVLIGRPAVE